MKVKNGIASSVSLAMVWNTRSGMACSNGQDSVISPPE
jgi:hypothetical protein